MEFFIGRVFRNNFKILFYLRISCTVIGADIEFKKTGK